MPKPGTCENPNCRKVDVRLTRADVKEGNLRLCSACYSHAHKHKQLRSVEMVRRAEERKQHMQETVHTCENPNCGKISKILTKVELEEGSFRLCQTCYCYALRCKQLRPAEIVVRAQKLEEMRKSRGLKCHNANCRSTNLENGKYGKENGEFYCHACATYLNNHGIERPRALVEARMRCESTGKGCSKCQNHYCMKTVQKLKSYEFKEEGWMRLCNMCYLYAYRHERLRTEEEVNKSDEMRRKRTLRDRCFNDNCRTTNLQDGGYGKHNNEFYCRACVRYVNTHNGEERPRKLVEASVVSKKECENPDCHTLTIRLSRTQLENSEALRVCSACYQHARRTGELRSAEAVRRAENRKKKKSGVLQCHNRNCRDTELQQGSYAKCNGEYYCNACVQYIDSHDGEERPRKLVEEQRLYRSRYMWQLNHPKLPED